MAIGGRKTWSFWRWVGRQIKNIFKTLHIGN